MTSFIQHTLYRATQLSILSHINMFVGDGSRNIKSIFFKFMFVAFYAKKFKVTMFIKVERDKLLL